MIPPSLRASRTRTLFLRLPVFATTAIVMLWTLAGTCAMAQSTSQLDGVPGLCSRQSTAELPNLGELDDHREVLPPPQVAQPAAIATKNKKLKQKYDVSAIGARKVDSGFNFYSFDREREMGKAMAQQLEGQVRLLADPMVNEYISRLAQRLIRHSDAKVPFVVKVVDSDEVNAFALPGGFFYVNTGLILTAQNEAELAGVLAHEIAHVAARHATRNMTKAQVWNLASIPLLFVAGPAGFAIRQVSSVAFPMSTLKFSRDAEREADLLGLEYDYAAGYDPEAFVSFFERLGSKSEKKNFLVKAFSTHPMNADRIHRAQQEITTMLPEKADYVVDTSEFEDVRAHLFHLMNAKPILGTSGTDGPVLRRRTEGNDQNTSEDRPRLERR